MEQCKKPTVKMVVIIAVVAVLAVSAVIAVTHFAPLLRYMFGSKWEYAADFDGYAEDFERVAGYFGEKYPNESKKLFTFTVANGLYDSYDSHYVKLPDDVFGSLSRLQKEAFSNKSGWRFNYIIIKGGKVEFRGELCPYWIEYSPDGCPKAEDGRKISTRRIRRHWYHVVYD